ncbi:LuxR family transcriptional activator of bioluminescence operon [Natronocella acetinitrilica]|uniref:LuxR family transcriptional activator of bioluminescence operon n=1 Tax=Natronocella acetinitrilica TaxID=414046 RepID=A0AAE3G385_9GAMM|nr:autoinducer binding domain-containing protein [Natronocella acetinitrilica]MCP1674612.1 LuxR family transcriptional activator of bioluminescence operon [Natronocella acetinitrilica]
MNEPAEQIMSALAAAGSREELYDVCDQICEMHGFDYFHYTAQFVSSLVRPTVLIVDAMPPGWRERYVEEGFFAVDPIARYSERNLLPATWREAMMRSPASERLGQLKAAARAAGLAGGVVAPARGLAGDVSLLVLASRRGGEDQEQRYRALLPTMHYYAGALHQAAAALALHSEDYAYDIPAMSARESECLFWAAEGKTAEETGVILDIARATVEYHLTKATQKLGASGRQQTVAKAMALGLIRPQLSEASFRQPLAEHLAPGRLRTGGRR